MPANCNIVKFVLHDLDLHFQGQICKMLISETVSVSDKNSKYDVRVYLLSNGAIVKLVHSDVDLRFRVKTANIAKLFRQISFHLYGI